MTTSETFERPLIEVDYGPQGTQWEPDLGGITDAAWSCIEDDGTSMTLTIDADEGQLATIQQDRIP